MTTPFRFVYLKILTSLSFWTSERHLKSDLTFVHALYTTPSKKLKNESGHLTNTRSHVLAWFVNGFNTFLI